MHSAVTAFTLGCCLGQFLVFASGYASGCAAARAATYESELVSCNQTALSLKASVDCENGVRARYGRPPRVLDFAGDGGAK